MTIPGKLELTLKINQFPDPVTTGQNGWKEFQIDCGTGREISITMRPKMFNKLEDARTKYPEWVAAISGQLGPATATGFTLTEPNLQVFEKKPKPPADKPPPPAT